MAQGLDSTKIAGRPSGEATEESGEESSASRIDKIAMESAKRAQNRIHADETEVPGSSEFTH
jgi:electron transfer flavoprotein alpha/beta subunit